jgi:D-alanyl-D-alanine carboxypeptidase (penicillin-binding protein 5/6)
MPTSRSWSTPNQVDRIYLRSRISYWFRSSRIVREDKTMKLSRLISAALCGMAAFAAPALAQQIDTPAAQAILLDYDTNEVLFCKNCTEQMAPSSMSKLMTVELVFQRLKDNRLKLEDTFHVSETAWRQGLKDNESKMWVAVNSDISVDNLLKGIIVQSGGDACVVVAEALGGTEASFADMENARAKEIGLTKSHFENASGLPDPEHYMTAEDLAKLAAHIIRDYPQYYHYFSIPDFTWSKIKQPNRLTLINDNIGVDGLKTGHTTAGGYGLVASSLRNGRRIVVVINGLKRERDRTAEARRLLDIGYREFKSYDLLAAGGAIGNAEVAGGVKRSVSLQVKDPVRILMSPDARKAMKATLRYQGPIKAPIAAGQEIGTLTIAVPGKPDKVVPVSAAENVPASGFFDNMMLGLQALVFGANQA